MEAETGLSKCPYRNQKKNYSGSTNIKDTVSKKLSEIHVTGKKHCQ